MPLLIAVVAIPTTFVFVYLLTCVTTMSTLVQNIVARIGLGVAVDYALLSLGRWRRRVVLVGPGRPAPISGSDGGHETGRAVDVVASAWKAWMASRRSLNICSGRTKTRNPAAVLTLSL